MSRPAADDERFFPASALGPSSPGEPPPNTNDRSSSSVAVVIPAFNSMPELELCLTSVLRALERYGQGKVVVVDNGSTDGSLEYLKNTAEGASVTVLQMPKATIGELRNAGAAATDAVFTCFLDSDCVVGPEYFVEVKRVLASGDADATGSRVALPDRSTWLERSWHELHDRTREGYVEYVNSGNFAIRSSAFDEVGGFRGDLVSGEDAELGQRLNRRGFRVYECPAVSAVHLGNSKTIGAFFRRQTWHGVGMLATVSVRSIDKPVAMLAVFLLFVLIGCIQLAIGPWSWPVRAAALVLATVAVPVATVAYRYRIGGGGGRPVREVGLYCLYYLARARALGIILLRRLVRREIRTGGEAEDVERLTKSFRPD